jgi:small conductance mechanosensitive channel
MMGDDVQKGMEMVHALGQKAAEFLITYGFQVIGALVVLFLGFKASQWAAGLTLKFLERRRMDLTVARFTAGTVKGLIFGFAIIVALGKFGITIAPIIAAIGAVAFGGTFALQGILSNMGSGLSLLLFRPFAVGDTIEVVGVSGVVEEVKLGATVLTNEDGERITVPNRHIVGEVLRNSFAYRAVDAVVGIGYGDDPERAILALRDTLRQFPDVATTPAPLIGIRDFGDSAINIGLRYWVPTKRYIELSYEINLAVFKALKAAGIAIPFPQRDVRIVSGQV